MTLIVFWMAIVSASGVTPWSAMETFNDLGDCKRHAAQMERTFNDLVAKHQPGLLLTRCLPAGTRP